MIETPDLVIRDLGQQDYVSIWKRMQQFTDERTPETADEIWLLEHFPVFTLGQNGKPEHILDAGNIPIIQVDRGGQVTYHGPGQLIAYVLLDLRRRPMGVRALVTALEKSVIDLLAQYGVEAISRADAPGIYVDGAKIGSVGLRVRRGCSYHGLAFNVAMDLAPFSRINPCGHQNLRVTQLADFKQGANLMNISPLFIEYLKKNLGYTRAL